MGDVLVQCYIVKEVLVETHEKDTKIITIRIKGHYVRFYGQCLIMQGFMF